MIRNWHIAHCVWVLLPLQRHVPYLAMHQPLRVAGGSCFLIARNCRTSKYVCRMLTTNMKATVSCRYGNGSMADSINQIRPKLSSMILLVLLERHADLTSYRVPGHAYFDVFNLTHFDFSFRGCIVRPCLT
jgi:hypothetical protein